MMKGIKAFSAIGLVLCVFLCSCSVNDGTGDAGADFSDNIIYAPVDTTEDNEQSEVADSQDVSDVEDVTDPPAPEDTDASSSAYTAEPTGDSDFNTPEDTAGADSDSVEDAEHVDTPAVDADTIIIDGDFLSGEHIAGSVVSRESEKLRLVLSYDCFINAEGSVTVGLEVGLECYDINCGPRANGGTVSINGNVYTFSTDEIIHEGAGMIYVPFETYMQQIDVTEKSCIVEASWFFDGVYADANLDTLTANVTLDWSMAE